MQQFDNSVDFKAIRRDVEAALRAVEEKHGVSFGWGSIRYNAQEARGKLTMTPKGAVNSVVTQALNTIGTPGNTALQRAAKQFNLDTARRGPKGETLVDYVPSRYKYPMTYQTVRGTRYKCDIEAAKRMFGVR